MIPSFIPPYHIPLYIYIISIGCWWLLVIGCYSHGVFPVLRSRRSHHLRGGWDLGTSSGPGGRSCVDGSGRQVPAGENGTGLKNIRSCEPHMLLKQCLGTYFRLCMAMFNFDIDHKVTWCYLSFISIYANWCRMVCLKRSPSWDLWLMLNGEGSECWRGGLECPQTPGWAKSRHGWFW